MFAHYLPPTLLPLWKVQNVKLATHSPFMSIVRYEDGLVNELVVEERNLGDINEQVFLRWAQEVNEVVAVVLLSTLTSFI